jgi:hypothetical protein
MERRKCFQRFGTLVRGTYAEGVDGRILKKVFGRKREEVTGTLETA